MMVLSLHILRRRLGCALHCMPNQAHSKLRAVTYVNLLLYLRLFICIAAWQPADKTLLKFSCNELLYFYFKVRNLGSIIIE